MITEKIYSSFRRTFHHPPSYPWKKETSVANGEWPVKDCWRGRKVHDKRMVIDSSVFAVVVFSPAAAAGGGGIVAVVAAVDGWRLVVSNYQSQ